MRRRPVVRALVDRRTSRIGACLALACVVATSVAADRVSPPRLRTASITGIVLDSLVTDAPLAHAEIELAGTALTATSDEQGRFRLDGVPAGRHRLTFFHQVLDTLGVGAGFTAVEVPDSGSVEVALATPTAGRVFSRLCGAVHQPSAGVLVGRVRDVESARPVAGALVAASWSAWSIAHRAITRVPQRVAVTSDSAGFFRLCDIAADVPVLVRAVSERHVSGPLLVHLDGRAFASRDVDLSLADTASLVVGIVTPATFGALLDSVRATTGTSAVAGRVVADDGRPVIGANVSILGVLASATTNAYGAFRIGALAAGTQTIEVRVLGFAPARVSRALHVGATDSVRVVVDKAAPVLANLNVVGRAESVDRTGFEQRMRNGAAGFFFTRDEIDRRHPNELRQLFAAVPGITMRWNGSTLVPTMNRGGAGAVDGGPPTNACSPQIYIDGVVGTDRAGTDIDFLNQLDPADVRAIEVYNSPAAVPARYRDPHGTCGAILIWTRRKPVREHLTEKR